MSYFSKLKDKIKKIPVHTWILLAIVLVGIFLRTYNFHDWLRFSMDQSRDALIISNAVEGKEKLPLLGPLAGGTFFHLGPAYYQFSFLSAKIFGNYPDKMAYPSLFFSILAIPLLYLFLREYFNKNISLAVTAVMSVSYFFVANSRFSSNPNLTPFFVLLFLYALLRILNDPNKNFWRWSILAGLSLGVGVQLHTTLLVIMPIFTVILFFYLAKKSGMTYLKYLLAIFAVALLINTSQVVNEFQTGWGNTKNFFDGISKKGEGGSVATKNAVTAVICQAKANAHLTFSLPVTEECSKGVDVSLKSGAKEVYGEIKAKNLRKATYALNLVLLFSFSLIGYILLVAGYRKEKEQKTKNFLGLIGFFNLVAIIFLVPVAASISVNYFIIIFFVPLVFFGLILKFFQEKCGKHGRVWILLLVAIPIIMAVKANLDAAYLYERRLNNNLENSDLKWVEDMSDFFAHNLPQAEIVYLSGEKKYLDRYAGPIKYMVSRQGSAVVEVDISKATEMIPATEEFIYIKNKGDELADSVHGYQALAAESFAPIDVYILKNN
ncbi:MAG: glycosyltransferase family 39 protein [Parcubacteria group bacterium]|jgi:hypothetical protein